MCNYVWSSVLGKDTNVTCAANKTTKWGWNFNGGPLPDNASPRDTTTASTSTTQLVITEVDQENTGTYHCEGYDENKLVEARACTLIVRNINGKHFFCTLFLTI